MAQEIGRWRVALALLRQAEGDAEAALDLLGEAERVDAPDFFPGVRPIPAIRARVLIRQGRLTEAGGWENDAGVHAGDSLSYSREYEHITLARLLLARGDSTPAMELLERLRTAADFGGRWGSVIEILVLQGLTHQADGDTTSALVPLARALDLAGPEGYALVFVSEGDAMAALLRLAIKRKVGSDVARMLLARPSSWKVS